MALLIVSDKPFNGSWSLTADEVAKINRGGLVVVTVERDGRAILHIEEPAPAWTEPDPPLAA